MQRRLLILDDDPGLNLFMRRVGEELGHAVRIAETVAVFRDMLDAWPPDSILLDLRLGERDDIEVLRLLAEQRCPARIVLISGVDDRTLASARDFALNLGLDVGEAVSKPVRADALRAALVPPAPPPAELTAADLAQGLARRELRLDYQPVIACATGAAVGLEALARWHRPGQGRIPPDRFIPLAEADPELTDRLTFAVAARAAEDWPVLTAGGFAGPARPEHLGGQSAPARLSRSPGGRSRRARSAARASPWRSPRPWR